MIGFQATYGFLKVITVQEHCGFQVPAMVSRNERVVDFLSTSATVTSIFQELSGYAILLVW